MKIIIILFLLVSFNTLANEKGNGGDAVICRNDKGAILKAELLDYYEGRSYRRLPHVFEGQFTNTEYLIALSDKLVKFDSTRFKSFKADSLEFDRAITEFLQGKPQSIPGFIFTEGVLTDIPDSQHLIIPKNCQVEQFVIRVPQRFPEDPKFIIQADILKSMSLDDLRGIILHESLYKMMAEQMFEINSKAARYLHQLITESTLDGFHFSDYINFLKSFPLSQTWSHQGVPYVVDLYGHSFNPRFPTMSNGFTHLWSDELLATYVFNMKGGFERESTLALEKFKLSLAYDECSAYVKNFKIVNSAGLELNWSNYDLFDHVFKEVPFGKVELTLTIDALDRRNTKCNGTGSLTLFEKGKWKELATYKIKNVEQKLTYILTTDLDQNLYPIFKLK